MFVLSARQIHLVVEGSFTLTTPMDNQGTVSAAAGTLVMAGGGNHSGQFIANSSANLDFDAGTHQFANGAVFSGTGTFDGGGTLQITGAEPGLAKAAALARALGVSLDWLADDTQGLPAVPAGETLGFTRLLSAEYREQLDRHMVSHGREVVLAAACRLLCEAEPERVGAALATSSVVKARSCPAAPPVTQAAAGAHRRQAARRGADRGDAPAVPPPGQRRNQSGRRSA